MRLAPERDRVQADSAEPAGGLRWRLEVRDDRLSNEVHAMMGSECDRESARATV